MPIVLVVDDEFGIAALLRDVLEDEGHSVLLASNGRQALERMAERRPDLVLTDFMMPVMDGAGLIDAIQADPAYRSIPIIVMSSMPEAAVAQKCSNYALFVRKPFRIFDVIDVVEKLLGARHG